MRSHLVVALLLLAVLPLVPAADACRALGSSFSFSPSSVTVNESDGSVTLTIYRFGSEQCSGSVSYATSDGTALAGSDYTAASGNATFASGVATASVRVPILNDAIHEPTETFTVTLSAPSANDTLGAAPTATVTILDDDAAPAHATFSPTSLAMGGVRVGTSASGSVTLTNDGGATLNLTTQTASAPFAVSSACPSTLAVGASCAIGVTFTPTAAGAASGTLHVGASDDLDGHDIPLSGVGTAPAVTLSVSSLDLGSVTVGATSAPQSITVTDSGTAALAIASVAASGPFGESNTCGAALAAGASCTVSVAFAPSAPGAATGAITITDDAPGSPHGVALTGNGVSAAAPVIVTPTSIDLGHMTVGKTSAPFPLTITNVGASDAWFGNVHPAPGFALGGGCPLTQPLHPGASCTMNATFTPNGLGAASGTWSLDVTKPTALTLKVALSGIGTDPALAPVAQLAPWPIEFGVTNVGTTVGPRPLYVNNTGKGTLEIARIDVVPLVGSTPEPEANISSTTCGATLAPGAGCIVNVTFTPHAYGSRGEAVYVYNNGGQQGDGLDHVIASAFANDPFAPFLSATPTPFDFPATDVNSTSAPKTLTITDTGNGTLHITNISILEGTFAPKTSTQFLFTTDCPAALAPKASCDINITFRPSDYGQRGAYVKLATDLPAQAQDSAMIVITGMGLKPVPLAKLGPWSQFPATAVGLSAGSQIIPLQNVGQLPLHLGYITFSGTGNKTVPGFNMTNDCPSVLAPNASCTFTITLTPVVVGGNNDVLEVPSDSAVQGDGSTQAVIQGVGLDPTKPYDLIAPLSVELGNTTVGTKASALVMLSSVGAVPLHVTNVTIGPSGFFFDVSEWNETNDCPAALAPNASCNVTITFAPTTIQDSKATLTFHTDAGYAYRESAKVALHGWGQETPATPTPSTTTRAPTASTTANASGTSAAKRAPLDVLVPLAALVAVAAARRRR